MFRLVKRIFLMRKWYSIRIKCVPSSHILAVSSTILASLRSQFSDFRNPTSKHRLNIGHIITWSYFSVLVCLFFRFKNVFFRFKTQRWVYLMFRTPTLDLSESHATIFCIRIRILRPRAERGRTVYVTFFGHNQEAKREKRWRAEEFSGILVETEALFRASGKS